MVFGRSAVVRKRAWCVGVGAAVTWYGEDSKRALYIRSDAEGLKRARGSAPQEIGSGSKGSVMVARLNARVAESAHAMCTRWMQ